MSNQNNNQNNNYNNQNNNNNKEDIENQIIINKTYLSHRGYGLLKSKFNYKLLNNIREELTVSPNTMSSFANSTSIKYRIYNESDKKLFQEFY